MSSVEGLLLELHSKKVYSLHEKSFIEDLYRERLGKRLSPCRCRNKYHDAVVEMLVDIRRKQRAAMNKYILKHRVAILYNGRPYTRRTITDEVAKAILAEHPEYSTHFEHLPEEGGVGVKKPKVVKSRKKAQ